MRTSHLLLASAACALLAGCDGGALTAPDAGPLAYTDFQCPDGSCGGTTVTPSYSFNTTTSFSVYYRPLVGTRNTHKGRSYSDIGSDRYTYATVSATARAYDQCNDSRPGWTQSASRTVYGPGTAEVSFQYESLSDNVGFVVRATHFFKASPSYSWLTDLTFTSQDDHCDDTAFLDLR